VNSLSLQIKGLWDTLSQTSSDPIVDYERVIKTILLDIKNKKIKTEGPLDSNMTPKKTTKIGPNGKLKKIREKDIPSTYINLEQEYLFKIFDLSYNRDIKIQELIKRDF